MLLSAHVSVIMLSYALLMLSIVDRRMLRAAVCLLAAGIFLGAVWANVSWGSYWSWDPKETWSGADKCPNPAARPEVKTSPQYWFEYNLCGRCRATTAVLLRKT